MEGAKYCTFHRLYADDIIECWDALRSSQRSDPYPSREDRNNENPRSPPRPKEMQCTKEIVCLGEGKRRIRIEELGCSHRGQTDQQN